MRRLLGMTAALLLVSSLPAAAATKGMWSLGANFGTGMYSNSELNDNLTGIEEVTSGWEYGGELRYQVSPKLAIGLEANRMTPKSTTSDPAGDISLSTPGMAIPVNLVYNLSENDKYAFNMFGGGGMITGAKLRAEQAGVDDEVSAGSSFYGQAGLEGDWMMSPTFSLGARVLGRTAKSEIENTTVNIDYTGFAFGLGARFLFGGTH